MKEDAIAAIRHDHANGLDVKEILDDMGAKLDDIEFTMKCMSECFYNAKDEFLRMVEDIVLPKTR